MATYEARVRDACNAGQAIARGEPTSEIPTAELDRLRAIEQAATDLLDAAGTHLDRILPLSTALLRAALTEAGISDTTPSDDEDDTDDWAATQQGSDDTHDDTAVTA